MPTSAGRGPLGTGGERSGAPGSAPGLLCIHSCGLPTGTTGRRGPSSKWRRHGAFQPDSLVPGDPNLLLPGGLVLLPT